LTHRVRSLTPPRHAVRSARLRDRRLQPPVDGALPEALIDYPDRLAREQPKLLEARQIPRDPALSEPDRHLGFLAAGCELIADRLSAFLVRA